MAGRVAAWMSALGLAACAAAPASQGAPALEGTRWVGVVEAGIEEGALPRLEFAAGGRVSGFTGCNQLSGTWSAAGGEARLGPLMTTKRFCPGPRAEVERRLLAAAGEGHRLRREGDRLLLTGAAERFEFRRG